MTQIANITVAASGIGRALASALVARSETVVVADIDGQAAERVAGELAWHGPGIATAAVEVRDTAAVHALVDGTRGQYGRLDGMVNNVGIVGEADQLLLDKGGPADLPHGKERSAMAEPGCDTTVSEVSPALPAAGDAAAAGRRRDRHPAPISEPGGSTGSWLVGLGTGCCDTVMAPTASRPGFGTADGGIAPAALPFRMKGARPWPR